MRFFANDTAVLDSKNKKIRNIIVAAGCLFVAVILALNIFLGFGRVSRPVIYYNDEKTMIYDINGESSVLDSYSSFANGFIDLSKTGGGEFKAHFDSKTYYKAEKHDDRFSISYFNGKKWLFVSEGITAMRFAQNGKDALIFEPDTKGTYTLYFVSGGKLKKMFEGCSDAAAVGRKSSEYLVYEQVNNSKSVTMFSNFKDKPFELGVSQMDADTAALSADGRKLMLVSGDERKLYVFNMNVSGGNTADGIEVGKSVIKASFTGLKNDFAFLDSSGDFYYSSSGYTFKEDEDVKKFEAGYDVMTVYYLKNNGDYYSFYVGDEKKLSGDVKDFYYAGSDNSAVIMEFNKYLKKGKLCVISRKNITETDNEIEAFYRY
ncbi:hypothetical protein MUJ63_09480 [Lachnospiraceae bacterium NSJ-143]|nr:hypothetical protein [Lachnospiraceae bacterium NSJ-143]